jgi:diaminopimelate decarboxylase
MTAAGNVTKPSGLAAKIWPRTTRLGPGGEIAVGGVPLSELAARYGTPPYILDEADVRDRCRAYARALRGAEIAYAGKAYAPRRGAPPGSKHGW